jgi:hypothetical protein
VKHKNKNNNRKNVDVKIDYKENKIEFGSLKEETDKWE